MALPAGYVGLYTILAKKARELGYAMALHGSLKRDMDLMCMPWVVEAVSPQELIEALCNAIVFLRVDAAMDDHFYNNPPIFPKSRIDGPEFKPHGRMAWNIQLGAGCFLDISVMPPRPQEALPLSPKPAAAVEVGYREIPAVEDENEAEPSASPLREEEGERQDQRAASLQDRDDADQRP